MYTNLDKETLYQMSKTKDSLEQGIYFLFKDRNICYVGQSVNIHSRVRGHIYEGRIEFTSFSYICAPQNVLTELEAYYIFKFSPKANSQMPPNKRFKSRLALPSFFNMTDNEIEDILRNHKGIRPRFKKYYDTEQFYRLFKREARKKRRKLRQYYEDIGANDCLRRK